MRILPFSLPVLLTMLFMGLAYADSTWIFAVLLFAVSMLNPYWGIFSSFDLNRTYRFFHHSAVMSVFKGANGLFFVLFNIWAAAFCVLHPFTAFSFATFVYGVVVVNSGFGLSLAHDLTHARQSLQRALGELLMLQNGFFYLSYDHVFIHHPHVGTPADPASAMLNENLYAYFRRSLGGRMRLLLRRSDGVKNARQKRLYRAVRWKMAACTVWLIVAFFISKYLFILVAAQFFFVILVYETTTYIQHYGLQRSPHEKIRLHHSWNSFDRLYNYLYFFMPVHSLHHAHAQPAAGDWGPVMPLSFPRMVLLAFRPAQWFRTTNPQVLELQAKQALVPAYE